jgi:hypothetical protein
VYGRSLGNGFIYDDRTLILNQPAPSAGDLLGVFTETRWLNLDYYRPGNADVLRTLAAAYACAGRFDDAVASARTALALNPSPLVRRELDLYLRKQPYREPVAGAAEH